MAKNNKEQLPDIPETMEDYMLRQLKKTVILNWRSSESRAKPRLSYAESRRKWAKAKDGNTLKDPHDGHEMTAEVWAFPLIGKRRKPKGKTNTNYTN